MIAREALSVDSVAAFAVFARHRNFTRAAEELHIAQPSLHAKIAKLGRSVDAKLYERIGRELRLTGAGEALATFAADQARAADDFLARFDEPTRTLRLAAGRAAIQWVLGGPLRAVVQGGADLRVMAADRSAAIDLVKTGEVDVAAIAYDPPPQDLRSVHLCEVPQVLLAPRSHPLASARSLRVRDLEGLALVVPPQGRPHRQSLERALDAGGVSWSVASEADGWDLIVCLAKLGVGLAIVNGCVPAPRPLVSVEIVDLPRVSYWLTWREQRQPIVEPLLNQVANHG